MNEAQQQFDNTIAERKRLIATKVREPLAEIAKQCLNAWSDPGELNQVMAKNLKLCMQNEACSLLYAVDLTGVQISHNHFPGGSDPTFAGQDLSARPYLNMGIPTDDFLLSDVYISNKTHRSCITAIYRIRDADGAKGYLCADFSLGDLQLEGDIINDRRMWLQVRGDPSIRSTLFMQSRTISEMDKNLDDVIDIMEELIIERGVFHAKLHYSSSRATIWLYSDPFSYRVHVLDELLHSVCLAYPKVEYPKEAIVSPAMVKQVFNEFRVLREADETIYLRASSLNIINGQVALNFSCDGSHYIPIEEFLAKDRDFWFGKASHNKNDFTS